MTTLPENEHRVETRLELEETVFIEVLASASNSPGNVIMCNSLDLSANGLQVVVDEEIAAGSILRLCVDLHNADPIFLVGEVKWKRPDAASDAYRLGFLLFESDDTDIQRWKEIVADMLAA
ncbi:MAG: PilZ domain-containing protein [Pseudomonadota bacterium]